MILDLGSLSEGIAANIERFKTFITMISIRAQRITLWPEYALIVQNGSLMESDESRQATAPYLRGGWILHDERMTIRGGRPAADGWDSGLQR